MASREKNGVFLAYDNYQSMLAQIEGQAQEIVEKIGQLKAMTEEMEKNEQMYNECSQQLQETTSKLESTSAKLEQTEHNLECTKSVLSKTVQEKEETKHLVEKHVETELKLSQQAKKLLATSDEVSSDLSLLHDKVDRGRKVEQSNEDAKSHFLAELSGHVELMTAESQQFRSTHGDTCNNLAQLIRSQFSSNKEFVASLQQDLSALCEAEQKLRLEATELASEDRSAEADWLDQQEASLGQLVQHQTGEDAKFQQKMAPIFEKIERYLVEKAEILESNEKCMLGSLSRLMQIFATYSQQISCNLDSILAEARSYTQANTESKEKVLAQAQTVQQSEQAFKGLLDELMAKYTEHSATIQAATSLISTEAKKDNASCSTMLDNIGKAKDKCVQETAKMETDTKEHSDKMTHEAQDFKTKFLELKSSVSTELAAGQDSIQGMVQARNDKMKQYQKSVVDRVAERKEKSSNFQQAIKENIDKSATQLTQHEATVVKSVADNCTKNAQKETEQVDTLDRLQAVTASQLTALDTSCANLESDVRNFALESLQRNLPTGTTPGRIERSYPRYLAATSPHERIIKRYRQVSAADTAGVQTRLNLDDMEDNESVISVSTVASTRSTKPVSRQNSTCSVSSTSGIPVVSSKRGSGSLSREPSGEMKPPARTSDLGSMMSEDAEQENREPPFRVPVKRSESITSSSSTSRIGKPAAAAGRKDRPDTRQSNRRPMSNAN
eukprot:TRINITY_DN3500_c0_g1_i10.p1 TRINITY_DN3500_c0_g1~~TRINITY_DN3500_c0_g1_i10.p1  ORF type:complete len:728 (-),score=254.95 TRINITY_DN3500_c0_g1_i10:261-2444(-)